ncbi:hypothetical protein CYK37_21265 [Mesorhizobium loti]|nr:hypothetical protein CYK37_21265 [Mesorhizobium loti]
MMGGGCRPPCPKSLQFFAALTFGSESCSRAFPFFTETRKRSNSLFAQFRTENRYALFLELL